MLLNKTLFFNSRLQKNEKQTAKTSSLSSIAIVEKNQGMGCISPPWADFRKIRPVRQKAALMQ
jgi:hypothetical protein